MKKWIICFAACALLNADEYATEWTHDITDQIPEIKTAIHGFQRVPNVAQYKLADWSSAVGIARDISLEAACDIANGNSDITFFFYMKGDQMILETEDGNYRVFRRGDAVFFTGEPWWGSAPGLADGYVR